MKEWWGRPFDKRSVITRGDVAAGVSRALVALAEAGALESLTLRSLRRITAPLEIRLPITPLWKGGEADRLLRALRGWIPLAVSRLVVLPELTANRSLVDKHASLFDAAFPARSRAVRT